MKIRDRAEFASKSAVMTFGPDETVFRATQAMSAKNYGAAVIVDGDRKPIGIVTERDFMRRLINNSLDPVTTPLSAIMTTDLKLARAEDDLLDWLRQMSNERFRHLPVVDENGVLVSIMSQGDFVSYTWPELMGRFREQAQATFAINPSMITAAAAGIVLLLMAILAVLASN